MRNVLFTLKVISDVVFKMKNDKNSESILQRAEWIVKVVGLVLWSGMGFEMDGIMLQDTVEMLLNILKSLPSNAKLKDIFGDFDINRVLYAAYSYENGD